MSSSQPALSISSPLQPSQSLDEPSDLDPARLLKVHKRKRVAKVRPASVSYSLPFFKGPCTRHAMHVTKANGGAMVQVHFPISRCEYTLIQTYFKSSVQQLVSIFESVSVIGIHQTFCQPFCVQNMHLHRCLWSPRSCPPSV